MLKTILAVLGVLAVLAILVIGGGGYYAYKKSSATLAQASQQLIDKYIATKHPPEAVANSLHRIENGVKLHPSWTSTMLITYAINVTQGDTVTDAQAKMLEEDAQLAEQDEVTRPQITAFMTKYQSVLNRQNVAQAPVAPPIPAN